MEIMTKRQITGWVAQTDPPRPPWETLPTMYDQKYRDTSPALLGRLFLPLDGELQSFEGCSPYRWGQGSRSPQRLFALGLR